MRGIRTLSTTLVLIAGLTVTTSTALGAESPDPLAAKTSGKLKILSDGQKDILKKNGIRVQAKVKKAGKLKTSVRSKTFDVPKFTKLGKPKKAKAGKTGKVKLVVKLNGSGLGDISECESRTIEVGVGKSSGKFDLVRNTGPCKPRNIDLSNASNCDFIAADEQRVHAALPRQLPHRLRPGLADRRPGELQGRGDAGERERSADRRRAVQPATTASAPVRPIVVKVPGLDTAAGVREHRSGAAQPASREYDKKNAADRRHRRRHGRALADLGRARRERDDPGATPRC